MTATGIMHDKKNNKYQEQYAAAIHNQSQDEDCYIPAFDTAPAAFLLFQVRPKADQKEEAEHSQDYYLRHGLRRGGLVASVVRFRPEGISDSLSYFSVKTAAACSLLP